MCLWLQSFFGSNYCSITFSVEDKTLQYDVIFGTFQIGTQTKYDLNQTKGFEATVENLLPGSCEVHLQSLNRNDEFYHCSSVVVTEPLSHFS